MKPQRELTPLEKRQAAALADDEDLELLTGFRQFRQWRDRREEARRPGSFLARQLSWAQRTSILVSLVIPIAITAFVVAGESALSGALTGLATAVGGFLVLSMAALRHPDYSRPRSLGDLVWTAGCSMVAALAITAVLLLVSFFF